MIKSVLTMGAALLAFGVTTAEARTFGHVAGGLSYVDDDDFLNQNADAWSYGFQGAVGFDLTPSWNLQLGAAYSNQENDFQFAQGYSVDNWNAGAIAFWRDPSKGMVGGEVAYQRTQGSYTDTSWDGYLIGIRGEYYAPSYTIGGSLNYNTFEYSEYNYDLNAYAGDVFITYYAGDRVGVTGRISFSSTDFPSTAPSYDRWTLGADVEYLVTENFSVSAVASYVAHDYFTEDFKTFKLGAELKFYFGTEGSLSAQHRTSTLKPSESSLGIYMFD
ncbi:MAG: hypothetical protein QM698_03360 [Micropepsaceae bacterium]